MTLWVTDHGVKEWYCCRRFSPRNPLGSGQMAIAIGRRKFISALCSASVAWPLAARAQQAERTRRIGVLMGSAENGPEGQAYLAAFREEFQKLGWTESRNMRFDTRWSTPNDPAASERFAKELVALQPDLLISEFTPTTAALLQQTHTIPIVFVTVSDPVGSGFVASFARPGGNVTGFVTADGLLGGKWLELLKEIAPRVTRVAVPFNPATTPYADFYLKPLRTAAAHFAMETIITAVRDTPELTSVVAAQAREPNSGLIVIPETFTLAHRVELTSLAARHSLPAVYPYDHSLNSAVCCPTESTKSIISGAQRPMPTASSRAQSRRSFPSRPRSSTSW
jgi:ABC-type uncharacterized transport system substrate-binding protein